MILVVFNNYIQQSLEILGKNYVQKRLSDQVLENLRKVAGNLRKIAKKVMYYENGRFHTRDG